MRFVSNIKIHQLLAKILFLAIPTLVVVYYILLNWHASFEIPTGAVSYQLVYFACGLLGAMLFYALGFRFVPTYLILIIGLYFLYKGIDATAVGEFDTFLLSIQFLVFALLLALGWGIGWGLLRHPKFSIILAFGLLAIFGIQLAQQPFWLTSQTTSDIALYLINTLFPVLLYVFFVIYFAQIIDQLRTDPKSFWFAIIKRLIVSSILLFTLSLFHQVGKILFFEEAMVKFSQLQNKGAETGLLKKNTDPNDPSKDAGYDMNDKISMSGNNKKENVLLFAAHINNYFDDNETPNPLYLVSFYYTKYDSLSETFERDTSTPDKDYFSPNLQQIPMYHSYTDSSVLAFGKDNAFTRNVEFDVYNKNLSPNFFVGPTTSYFVQPIAVEPMYRKEFTNAYRGKSKTSEFNSAYFVYSVDDPFIVAFQAMRNNKLKSYANYAQMDSSFMAYYTQMPQSPLFTRIDSLAKTITKDAPQVIDKVLAIKQYFQARDSKGKKIFRYSDNPGEPNLPGSSKLQYFLFESKQGYCAYYAAATLYMLRSLGIPSRVVGGFLTEDRSSDKNKGWYWYYADQAHAWVQVYIPGIGWIDFDTTIDNDDARESPQTDGTPPLQPNKASFASYGVFQHIDTLQKKGMFLMTTAMVLDKNVPIKPMAVEVDLRMAQIQKDTTTLSIAALNTQDSVTIVSFATVFQKLKGITTDGLQKMLPTPIPVDEIHLMEQQVAKQTGNESDKDASWSLFQKLLLSLCIVLLLVLVIFSIPYICYAYLKARFSKAQGTQTIVNAYKLLRWQHKFFLSQAFDSDINLFAQMDKLYQTQTSNVLQTYHHFKYGKMPLKDEVAFKQHVWNDLKLINNATTSKQKFYNWTNISNLFK